MSVDDSQKNREGEYRLVYLLDCADRKGDKLSNDLQTYIEDQVDDSGLSFDPDISRSILRFQVRGPLTTVDEANGLIASFVEHKDVAAKRLIDDVSAKFRRDAYPVIAKVETRLRRFILEVAVGKLGFDWSESLGNESVRDSASGRQDNARSLGLVQQWIDFTQFGELVSLITADLGASLGDEPLTYADLKELLEDAEDLDELRADLKDKTQKRSLWNEVFGKFFKNEDEWKKLEDLFDEIVDYRHIVMHHRVLSKGYHEQMLSRCEEVLSRLPEEPHLREGEDAEEVRTKANELQNELAQAQRIFSNIDLDQLRDTRRAISDIRRAANIPDDGFDQLADTRRAVSDIRRAANIPDDGFDQLAQAQRILSNIPDDINTSRGIPSTHSNPENQPPASERQDAEDVDGSLDEGLEESSDTRSSEATRNNPGPEDDSSDN